MDPTRHERLTAIFLEASELPAAEREAFLDQSCGGDPDLRIEVESLLRAEAGAGRRATERLASPVRAAVAAAPANSSEAETALSGPPRIAHFRILRRLGSGGAGAVFEALDERMGRNIALKVMSSTLAMSERATRRFDREAWIVGRLIHPNIVKVHERGTWEGYRYYSMELSRGGSLRAVVESMRRHGRDDRLGHGFGSAEYIHWAVRQTVLAARALHLAHREGVIHRDVKPENLLLDGDPLEVRLADFGIAKDAGSTQLTSEGQAIGTVCYMAPEQILQLRDEIDGRTDQYALGVTLFELLTLEYPYRGDTHQRYVNAVLADEARRPREINGRVSRDLEVVIRKSLEKDRRDRYEDMESFAEDLESVLHLRPIRAKPQGAVHRAVKWARRKPLHAAFGALLAVTLPAAGLAGYQMSEQARLLRGTRVQVLEMLVNQAAMDGDNHWMMAGAEEILGLDPRNALALRTLAAGSINLSEAAATSSEAEARRGEALDYAERAIEAQPRIAGHRGLKADILERAGLRAQAEEEQRISAQLSKAEEEDEDGLYYAGVAAVEHGQLDQAEDLFTRLIAIRRRPEALLYRAKVRVLAGRLDRERGETSQQRLRMAIEDYRSVVALRPMDAYPHHEAARVHTELGQFGDARAHLDRAVALAPSNALVHEVFANLTLDEGRKLMADGDREGALSRFREAEGHAARSLALDPERPYSHLNLGASIVEQARATGDRDRRRMDSAIEHYAKARDWAPRLEEPAASDVVERSRVNTCDLLIELRDIDRAIASCKEVVALLPDEAVAHYNLAGAYALAGREDEALAELEQDFELGDRDHAWLLSDAWFADLHGDPRFQRIVSRMRNAASKAAPP